MLESWGALERLAADRHREILDDARMARLAAEAGRGREIARRARWRLRAWIGRGLVALGTRMQQAGGHRSQATGLRQAS